MIKSIKFFGGIIEQEDIKSLREELTNLKRAVREAGIEVTDELEARKLQLKERAKEAMNKAKESKESIEDYAKEHPWAWMAIGVGVGLFIALLAKKGKHDWE